jgi:hypothetical protein
MWALGSQLLLKYFPNDDYSPGNDFVTQEFLRSQSGLSIPLISQMELLSRPTDKTYLLLMSRAESVPLSTTWPNLSEIKESYIREQLLIYLKEPRQFTSSTAQSVDGKLLDDHIIGDCPIVRPHCKKIGSTTENWFENIAEELRSRISNVHKMKGIRFIEA